jgi:hypothetical protein
VTRSKKNYRGRRLHKIGDRNDLSLDVCTGDAPLLQQCDLLLQTYLGVRKKWQNGWANLLLPYNFQLEARR